MNNYGYQNNFGGFGGVTPNAQFQNGVKVTPWLSAEDINMLKKDTEQFSLAITEEELKRAMCNHRELSGMPSLKGNDDGTCTCYICGHTFSITNELTNDQVVTSCNVIENILQTIKLLYNSMDPTTGREFFQILAFIKKIPKLYEIASNDFKKYEGVYGFSQGSQQNAFAIFGSLTNPGFGGGYNMGMGNPQYTGQQPMYNTAPMGYAPQQPMYGNAPQMNPQMGNPFVAGYGMNAPQQPPFPGQQGFAPTGYAQPTIQQPVNGGFAMNPQGAAAPQAQQTAAPKADSPVDVKSEFKA